MPINTVLTVEISNRCVYSIQEESDADLVFDVYKELTMIREINFFLVAPIYTATSQAIWEATNQALENVK